MYCCAPFFFVAQPERTKLGWKVAWFESCQQIGDISHVAFMHQRGAEGVCATDSREGLTNASMQNCFKQP